MNALAEAGGPLCDDCLAPAAGWNNRQQANSVGTKLGYKGEISREKGTCAKCGKHKLVSDSRGSTTNPKAMASPSEAQATSVTPVAVGDKAADEHHWYWEGHVQAAIVG